MKFGGHFVGEKIGTRTLTAYGGRNKHGHHTWSWRASCCSVIRGPSTIAHLRVHKSLRCLTCSRRPENNGRWIGYKEIQGRWFSNYRSMAKQRGHPFTITIEYLWKLWEKHNGRCRYTGIELKHGSTASLDRINNSRGYVAGNVQWVHRDINRMKSDFDEKYFLCLCRAVSRKKP